MALQPGIEHLLDLAMAREEAGHNAAILVVLLHADGERLGAAQYQPALEGRQDRASGLLHEGKLLGLLACTAYQHAAETIAVAVEELGRRVHDHVGTEANWLLEVRRHECVVDHHLAAML